MIAILLSVQLAYADERCADWDAAAPTDIRLGEVEEASGLALGRLSRTLYALEDSGHDAVLHLVDLDSGRKGVQLVRGATNTDWEDLGTGPCPPEVTADACLWIADTGDNDGARRSVTLWALPESTEAAVDAVACPRTFPESDARDAEALLVGADGTLRLVAKENDGQAHVYTTEARCDGEARLLVEEAVLEVPGPITGGAVDATGTLYALRTATHALVWSGCTPDWTRTPAWIALGDEEQGEALALDDDGNLWTASEGGSLRPFRSECARTEAADECPALETTCACGAGPAWPPGAAAWLAAVTALSRRRGPKR